MKVPLVYSSNLKVTIVVSFVFSNNWLIDQLCVFIKMTKKQMTFRLPCQAGLKTLKQCKQLNFIYCTVTTSTNFFELQIQALHNTRFVN